MLERDQRRRRRGSDHGRGRAVRIRVREREERIRVPDETGREMREKEEYKKNKTYATHVPYRGKFVMVL